MFRQAQSQDDSWDDDHTSKMQSTLPLSGITLPDLSDVDMGALPILESQVANQQVSFAGELTNRCGIAYFSGLISSGLYGAFRGYQLTNKGMPFRLKLNSMLNHSMKLGANNGNMFAVLALYFVTTKRLIPKLSPIDVNHDLNLIISGASTGAIYKSFSSWKIIGKYSAFGALLPTSYVVFKYFDDNGIL